MKGLISQILTVSERVNPLQKRMREGGREGGREGREERDVTPTSVIHPIRSNVVSIGTQTQTGYGVIMTSQRVQHFLVPQVPYLKPHPHV